VDRLLRLNDELEQLINLSEQTGVKVATVEGDIDLSTPQGRLIARVLVSVARAEVETKTARQKLANAQHAALGRPYGSVRCYGYERGYSAIREAEATVLREMAKRVIQGHSFFDVTYWANEAGHKTAAGGLWLPSTVKRVLTRKAYAGIREYQGAEYPGTWQPIFDAETWERLQLTMGARKERYKNSISIGRKYLLTGLVVCGVCGKKMIGTGRYNNRLGERHYAYHCRKKGDYFPEGGCGSVSRGRDALDHYVTSLVLDRLDSPALGKLLSEQSDDGRLTQLLEGRQLQRLRLDGLVDDYASGLLSRQELVRAKATAEAELQRLDAEIGALTANTQVKLDVGQTLQDAWERNPDSWRRALLELVIKSIVVNKTRKSTGWYKAGEKYYRFRPESVEIHWSDGEVT
jgi:hypothetical protein